MLIVLMLNLFRIVPLLRVGEEKNENRLVVFINNSCKWNTSINESCFSIMPDMNSFISGPFPRFTFLVLLLSVFRWASCPGPQDSKITAILTF